MKQTVIAAENLTRCFGQLTAVNALTLEILQGEVVGLLGHNGAGKTTTVRLCNGLLAPTQGSIRVLNLDPLQNGPALRRQTGVLPETSSIDEKLTALEDMTIFGQLYGLSRSDAQKRSRDLLNEFNLADRINDRLGTYSKGMRQRLVFARTLLHDPQLLFLDEPTSGLDPVATRQVHEIIQRLSQDGSHTIVMCTHNLNEAQQLCDKVAVLEHGRLFAYGPPNTLSRGLTRGVKLEIDFEQSITEEVLQSLSVLTSLDKIEVKGQTMTLWLPDRHSIPDIINKLVAGRARITRVNPVEPNLEDVYFALHDQQTHEVTP